MKIIKLKVHIYIDVPSQTDEINNEELGAAITHAKNTLEAHLEHLSIEMHRFKMGRIAIDYLGIKRED